VPVHTSVPGARSSQQQWYDLFHHHAFLHVDESVHVNSAVGVEDDQSNGLVNVLLLLSLCGCISLVNLRLGYLSSETIIKIVS